MERNRRKKVALFLCLSLLLGTFLPQQISGPKRAIAAEDADNILSCMTGYSTFVEYNSAKAGATYSCTVSNKKVAKPTGGTVYTNPNKKSGTIYMILNGLTPGEVTIKLKETYKGKTKVVKKDSLVVTKSTSGFAYFSSSYLPYDEQFRYTLQLEKGDTVNLLSLVHYYEMTPSFSVSDTSIASCSKNLLTAKEIGQTTVTMTIGADTSELLVTVVERGNETVAKARTICEKIDKLYSKKVTAKNVISIANKLFSYRKQLNDLSDYYYDTSTLTQLHIYKHTYNDFREKLESVVNKKILRGYSGASLEGITVKKATTKKASITFTDKVSKYDILANRLRDMNDFSQITDKSVFKYDVIVSSFCYSGNIKLGAKKATLKIQYNDGEKGKNYYSTHTSSGKLTVKSVNVK